MTYQMKLQNDPFIKIKEETKTIELRLNDEKRSQLTDNDFIEFTNITTNEKLLVKIEKLYHYQTFEELYSKFSKEEMGYSANEECSPKDMEAYYPKEKQDKYGVLGIKIKLITTKKEY